MLDALSIRTIYHKDQAFGTMKVEAPNLPQLLLPTCVVEKIKGKTKRSCQWYQIPIVALVGILMYIDGIWRKKTKKHRKKFVAVQAKKVELDERSSRRRN